MVEDVCCLESIITVHMCKEKQKNILSVCVARCSIRNSDNDFFQEHLGVALPVRDPIWMC